MPETAEYAVDHAQSRALTTALDDLEVQADAHAVFLCDNGGNILASSGQADDAILQTVAALAAGSFVATRELATLLGEKEFHSVLHQGSDKSIFMQSGDGRFIVVVVFDENTTVGLVKLYVGKSLEQLRPILARISTQTIDSVRGARDAFELDPAARGLFAPGQNG